MNNQILYKELAEYYDLIYSWKKYKEEADKLFKIILKYKKSKGKDLLEAACGTGHHLKWLKSRFNCTGMDINRAMLKVARRKVPGVALHKGNMINFRLKKKFDAITCLFSSIGYVKTYTNLKKTITNFSYHLKKGGVLLIEPWFTKSTFHAGNPFLDTYTGTNIKIARASVSRVKNDVSIVEMHHLIAEKNKGIRHYADMHELGLFKIKDTLKIMRTAGLKGYYLKDGLRTGRGLYVGVKE